MDTPFKCPYNNFSCPYYDTSRIDVSMLPCSDCKHFYNDVRMTGGMPNLEKFVNLIKKIYEKDIYSFNICNSNMFMYLDP